MAFTDKSRSKQQVLTVSFATEIYAAVLKNLSRCRVNTPGLCVRFLQQGIFPSLGGKRVLSLRVDRLSDRCSIICGGFLTPGTVAAKGAIFNPQNFLNWKAMWKTIA